MTAGQEANGQEANGARRRPKGRSPSYPGISLKTAVNRAQVIYDKEGRNQAPMSAITGHWGYRSPGTGPATVTYAALRKFGLLADEGNGNDRVGKLSGLALDILMNPDPAETVLAIQTAALLPPIHREMWDQYGHNLPSDETMRYRLVIQGGFTETGFQEFIREYRETIAYAHLLSAGSLDRETETPGGQNDDHEAEPPPADQPPPPKDRRGGVSGQTYTIPVPIIGGKPVTIEGEFPISEAAWTQFLSVLAAMKPGLVQNPELDSTE